MNVLAIGAHPDDVEYGCGGSLLRFAGAGHGVYLFVATGGEQGGEAAVRRREQEASAGLLGAAKTFWGGYADTRLPLEQELISKIEAVVSEVQPSLIFGHAPSDTHQDHRVLADATLSATRYTKNVLLYEVPTTENFMPTIFISIRDTLGRKIEALRAHESQVDKTRIEDLDIVTIARSNANFRGIQGRTKYAEGFLPVRYAVEPAPGD
ncbi:MAG: PIG-L deacetylase family protein [bacterium]